MSGRPGRHSSCPLGGLGLVFQLSLSPTLLVEPFVEFPQLVWGLEKAEHEGM